MKKILLLVILNTIFLNGQTLEFSLKLQTSAWKKYNISKSEGIFKHGYPPLPTEIHLGISYYPLEFLGIDVRIGRVFLDYEITGMEYSLLGKYFLFHSAYLIGGYSIHSNESGGGNSQHWKTVNLYMPGLGIGFKLSKLISSELIFFDPKDKVIEFYTDDFIHFNQIELSWFIKFNIAFNWEL